MAETTTNDLRGFYENEYVRSFDNVCAPRLDDFMYMQVLRELKKHLKPGMNVLDLGCNTGSISFFIANAGCHVTGIDLARNAIEVCKKSAKCNNVTNATFSDMDFVNEWDMPQAFDLVFCNHVIEHIPDDVAFLKSIAFALKDDGYLVLLTPTVHSSMYRVNKLLYGKFGYDEYVGHLRRYSRKTASAIFAESGFLIDNVSYLDSMLREWLFLFKPLRMARGIFAKRYIRQAFNTIDLILAKYLFPATICLVARLEKPE